jgi:frataxin
MSGTTMSKLALRTSRQVISSSARLSSTAARRPISSFCIPTIAISGPRVSVNGFKANSPINPVHARAFSASRPNNKGLSPESENPPIKETEDEPVATATDISAETYHEVADDYMNALVEKLEQLQEETEDIDVEYTVRVSTPSLAIHRYIA